MIFKAFDLVTIPFPFTDRDATKRRPTLVISNAQFNKQYDQFVLVMITTDTDKVWPGDVSLTNWQEIGLKVACHVRLKLFTLYQNLDLKIVGHLTSNDVKSAQAIFAKFVDVN